MERQGCEFFLVRYVPDRVKSEFVNIGLLLREKARADLPGGGPIAVRFTRNWSRVRCVDPDADIAGLEALESELRARLESPEEGASFLALLEQTLSNGLQLTAAKPCLAESLPAAIDKLMRLYVESPKRETVSRKGGRQAVYSSMRSQFERAGVWEMMRKRIAASEYTQPGDPLRIDCGYRPNGVIRMFHAVSLEGDLETAKVLAFSVAAIREGMRRVEQAELELTAIVQPLGAWAEKTAAAGRDDDRVAQYRFAVETMERETIRVMTTGDLPRIAEAARRELRI